MNNIDFLRKTEKYFANLIKEIKENGKYQNLKILWIYLDLKLL